VSRLRSVGMDPAVHADAVAALVATDAAMAALHRRNGDPPLWARPSSFASMVLFILEQQVSLSSAKAAFVRLHEALGAIEPSSFLGLADDRLRSIGFSRQKTSYCRGIAHDVLGGTLDFAALDDLDDGEVRRRLTSIRGVGPWTAEVFALFCLGRANAWPSGDRALAVATGRALGLEVVPSAQQADEIAIRWQPWRGVAAFFLWHDYLGGTAYQDDGVVADILG